MRWNSWSVLFWGLLLAAADQLVAPPGEVSAGGQELASLAVPQAAQAPVRRCGAAWTRQFGSDDMDEVTGMAVDGQGNIYVAGWSIGALPGQASAGGADLFLRKYGPGGREQWTRQGGSSDYDVAIGVAADAAGNSYVVGWTAGALPGQASTGRNDAFIARYGPSGEALWTHQFGSDGFEVAVGVAVDGQGNALWTRQSGSPSLDQPNSLVVDGDGSVYVVGFTNYAPPEKRPAASASAVGYSEEATAADLDIFIWKYDAWGQPLWSFQCGTGADDEARAVATNGRGAIYISGWTAGRMLQRATDGGDSGFLLRISPAR